MRQVLQSGLLGQVFLLWLNLSPSIPNVLKEVRKSRLKLSSLRQRPINHCFPRSSMTKTKELRVRGDRRLSRRSRSRDRLQVPGYPAGIRENETHKELPCAHVNAHYLHPGDKVAPCLRYHPTTFWSMFCLLSYSVLSFSTGGSRTANERDASPLCEIVIVIDQNKSLHMNPL